MKKSDEQHIEQTSKCSSNSNNGIKFIPCQQQPQHQQSTESITYLELVRKNILQITSISPGKISSFKFITLTPY